MHSSPGHRRTVINCKRLPTIIAQAAAEVQAVKDSPHSFGDLYWNTLLRDPAHPAKIRRYFKSWPAALKRMRLDQEVLPEPSWTANCGFSETAPVRFVDEFENFFLSGRGAVESKVTLGTERVGVVVINLPSSAVLTGPSHYPPEKFWYLVYIDRRYVVAYRPDYFRAHDTQMYLLGDSLEEGYTNLLLACCASNEERPRYARRVDTETGHVLHHADNFV